MNTVQLLHRIGRRARGGDFTKLTLAEQGDLLEAATAALQRVYNALPVYFKEQTQGFTLAAPLAVTGIGVTQFGKTVTGITFAAPQYGQSIALDGDPGWNQILGPAELLNPYMGATGTVNGTVYGNAIYSTTYPLDRIIGNPRFANGDMSPMIRTELWRGNESPGWLFQQAIGRPQVWWAQAFGNSQGRTPLVVLRFAPAPDTAYAVNLRIGFWPMRLTLTEYANATVIVVPDQFLDTALIPMALQELTHKPVWDKGGDEKEIVQAGVDGEKFLLQQIAQVGAPNNRIFTPVGY